MLTGQTPKASSSSVFWQRRFSLPHAGGPRLLGRGLLAACVLAACASASPDPQPAATSGSGGTTITTSAGAGASAGGAGGGGTVATAGAAGTAGTATGGTLATTGGTAGATGGVAAGGGGSGGQAGGAAGGPAATPNAIDTIQVPASGIPAATKSLDTGELYLLKATGATDAGADQMDAEYGAITGAAGQDMVGGVDVGIDVGINFERVLAGVTAGRKKWFGAYRADHTYYMIVTGTGAPLSLKMLRAADATSMGNIRVEVLHLSPTPALPTALETLMTPLTQTTVKSTMSPASGGVYLLQAAGSGKVGGGNLAEGDADWMDYDANGGGKVDVGDANTDYGLGVDESNPKAKPRPYWWGQWRKDHTYFLLYAGNGGPINFTYIDVGYGDNSTTYKLTVKIFPVP